MGCARAAWRGALVLLVALLVLLVTASVHAERTSGDFGAVTPSWLRDWWTERMQWDAYAKRKKWVRISEAAKSKNEWKIFSNPDTGRLVPYLHRKSPTAGMQQGGNRPVRCIVFCHGGITSNEFYYDEIGEVLPVLPVDWISVEYPGFGARGSEQLSEHALLGEYPDDVVALMRYLGLSWAETVLWGQCLGVTVATHVALHPEVARSGLPLFCWTKPMHSLRKTIYNAIAGPEPAPAHRQIAATLSARTVPERLLWPNVAKLTRVLHCPLLCIEAAEDTVCRFHDTTELFAAYPHERVRVLVARTDHSMSLLRALRAAQDAPSCRHLCLPMLLHQHALTVVKQDTSSEHDEFGAFRGVMALKRMSSPNQKVNL